MHAVSGRKYINRLLLEKLGVERVNPLGGGKIFQRGTLGIVLFEGP